MDTFSYRLYLIQPILFHSYQIFHYQIIRYVLLTFINMSQNTEYTSSAAPTLPQLWHPMQTSLYDQVQLSRSRPYHSISTLETKILGEDPNDLIDEGHTILQGRGHKVSDEDLQQHKWTKLISDLKQQVILWFSPYLSLIE